MEKGYFQPSLSIQELDERVSEQDEIERIPLPNQLPAKPQVSFEAMKSATVQSLMEQNEDLAARLKVALKKQLFLENQNDGLTKANQKFSTQFAAFSDQILVWKEKERSWKEKLESLEAEYSELKARIPEIESLEESLVRYKKYHEKVKTQVKPFIQGLKAYAESLGEDVRRLNAELEKREARERDLELRLEEIRGSHEQALRSELQKQIMIVQGYESSRDQLLSKLTEQQQLIQEAQTDREELRRLKIREDDLSNRIIALERDRKDRLDSLASELSQVKASHKSAMLLLEERELRVAESEKEIASLNAQVGNLQEQLDDALIQLSTQRRLWTEQAESLERLKIANQALEKINRQLSRSQQTEPAQPPSPPAN